MSSVEKVCARPIDWWIADNALDRGGQKKLGPFVSRELAACVRGYVEKVEGHESLWVCPVERESKR